MTTLNDARSMLGASCPSDAQAPCTDGRTDGLTDDPLTAATILKAVDAHARRAIRGVR